MSKKAEWRNISTHRSLPATPARLCAMAEGYAMIRRKGAMPFVVSEKKWLTAPMSDETMIDQWATKVRRFKNSDTVQAHDLSDPRAARRVLEAMDERETDG